MIYPCLYNLEDYCTLININLITNMSFNRWVYVGDERYTVSVEEYDEILELMGVIKSEDK